MKTALIQQVPQQWDEILGWIAAGEEVQVMRQDTVIAKLVPVGPATVVQPDFLGRARAIWGDQPAGKPLSVVVDEARGNS